LSQMLRSLSRAQLPLLCTLAAIDRDGRQQHSRLGQDETC
jgi:hypothetical protein